MARTATQITDEDMVVYRTTARQREAQARQEQEQRAQRARIVAHEAAALLKERFGARDVVLYGSLARQDFFHQRSDIDLAVRGIRSQDFWRAWAALDLLSSEFDFDLVDAEAGSLAFRSQIEQEGIEL
jgi:predicted nucleotidyltransferase